MDYSKLVDLKTSGRLPSPKGVALAVMQLTQQDDVTNHEIARVIKSDPALAARIIKAANAANLLGRRPVASVPDALVVLGLPTVRQLVLGFSLLSSYRDGQCRDFDYQGFWSHSLVTAIATQAISLRTMAASPEETFVNGLLSRVGCLALATLYPDAYSQVLKKLNGDPVQKLAALEQQVFAMDHNELTAALLADWGIPKVLVEPAYHHENPAAANFADGSRSSILVHSLHLASHLADICLAPEKVRRAMLPGLFRMGTRIGVEANEMTALGDQIVKEWQEWGRILDVETREVPAFDDLASHGAPGPEAAGTHQASVTAVPCKLRLLVVENDPALRRVLENTMGEAGHTVFTASDGKEGLELALGLRPQLIITEWAMPEMDGINFCKVLRQTKAGRRVYVLILSDSDDDQKLIEAFEAGADDYIVKPFDPMVLGARLRAGQRVIQLQDEIELDRQDIRRIATELAVSNQRLQQVALTDPLTGVSNRRFAMERLDQEWAAANRSGHPLSCLVIDVDHFKQVNDTYGHDIGDEVLKLTAETLKRSSRVQDTVSRVGGEEFLVICPDTDATAAHQCADRLRKAVAAAAMVAGGFTIQVTISIGVATRDKTMADPDALTKLADRAVYQAKRAGRNRTVAGKASGTE